MNVTVSIFLVLEGQLLHDILIALNKAAQASIGLRDNPNEIFEHVVVRDQVGLDLRVVFDDETKKEVGQIAYLDQLPRHILPIQLTAVL